MRNFLYRCPITGFNVQGSVKLDKPPDVGSEYHVVNCPACGSTHIVNPGTGKLLREERENPNSD